MLNSQQIRDNIAIIQDFQQKRVFTLLLEVIEDLQQKNEELTVKIEGMACTCEGAPDSDN